MYAISGQSGEKTLITKNGVFSMTNNNTYFKIELNTALAVGDKITAKSHGGVKNDVNKGLWVSTTDGYPTSAPACAATAATPTDMTADFLNYTVTEGDEYVGKTTLYVYRAAGATQNFDEFKVVRDNDSRTTATLTFATTSGSADIATESTYTLPTLTKTPTDATVIYTSSNTGVATVDASTGTVTLVAAGTAVITASFAGNDDYTSATAEFTLTVTNSNIKIVGYTEAINGTKLDARTLSSITNVSIAGPTFGSNIANYSGTSKTVYIDNTSYASTDSWRKGVSDYTNQYVGYTLTVASGYKMNVSHVSARIAVADDTYTWYVEILNGAGTQVWKSGEKTTTKKSAGVVDADVTDKTAIQGLTGNVTVNLYVKQGGSTKYFCINYLQLEVSTEIDDRATYAMSVSQNIAEAGSVTPADGSEITEGESVAFTATPATAYKFVKWIIDEEEQTTNPYTIENVTATHTAQAVFAKRYVVSYSLGDYAGTITGKVLCNVNRDNGYDEIYSDDDDNYTIPAYAHKYLYREGYIFDKWQDGDGNTYDSGDVIAMTKDITLTPTWKATSQTLAASGTSNTVTWSFAKADMLFTDWQSDDKYGYQTLTATVNGEAIAVPMQITKGKVGNWGRTDAIAQTNQNTTFTIPAVSGMTITISDAYKEFSTTTIAGSTDYEGTGTKSISYTYTGTDASIDIVVGESGQYLKTIVVTYPVTLTQVSITPANAKSTYVTTVPLDFSAVNGLKAYVATKAEAGSGSVTLSEVGAVPAKTPLMLIGTAGTEYTVPVAASATAPETNLFLAGDGTTVFDGSTYDFILYSDGLFYQIGSGTVATTKAYLHCESDPRAAAQGARGLSIVFEDETTGIGATLMNSERVNNEVYNLNGQRVAQPTKGLYIVNGKKVVIK